MTDRESGPARAAGETPVAGHLSAMPLAEGRWLWRRVYVFSASLGLWLLLGDAVRQAPPEALVPLAQGLMGLQGLVLVLYLVAPTAQQLVELLANLRLRLGAGGQP